MTSNSPSLEEISVTDLFEETLKGDFYDDAPWEAINALRSRGTSERFEEVFQKAVEFSKSKVPLRRARALNVLGQLGCTIENSSGIHVSERLEIALNHLSDESEMVVEAAAWALAHMRGEKAIKALLTVRRSKNEDVRHAVATGLLGETSPEAVEALLELMEDVDDDVRDYAIWSLASEPISGSPIDTPQIREALRRHLNDSYENARLEAIWGLALRKDPEGLRILWERMESDELTGGDRDTAAYLLGLPFDAPDSAFREGLRDLIGQE